jgi:hypothetical protein
MNSSGRIENYDYEPNGCWPTTFCYFIICVILISLCSCKSIQYVPVETVIHDSIQVERVEFVKDTTNQSTVVRDSSWMSIHIADSTELANAGIKLDGVTKAFVIERNKVRELENKLSSAKEKVVTKDSIVYRDREVQVPIEVPAKLTAIQQMKMEYGGYAILLVLISLVFVLYRFARKLLPRW